MAKVAEILPLNEQDLFILRSKHYARWFPGDSETRTSALIVLDKARCIELTES